MTCISLSDELSILENIKSQWHNSFIQRTGYGLFMMRNFYNLVPLSEWWLSRVNSGSLKLSRVMLILAIAVNSWLMFSCAGDEIFSWVYFPQNGKINKSQTAPFTWMWYVFAKAKQHWQRYWMAVSFSFLESPCKTQTKWVCFMYKYKYLNVE